MIAPLAFDFHTHDLATPPGRGIVCLPREVVEAPDRFVPVPGALYAAGVHPWWTGDVDALLAGVWTLLQHPQVVMVGECGFDTLRGPALDIQQMVFERQVAMSEAMGKPVTLHCVRAWDRVLAARRALRPTQTWTIHGFRGKPALARQLLAAGFDLSFGPRRNQESWDATPPERRHEETDAE